ncbi:MAG: adenylate/guanylate cyclase domain-containing protein [Myxococcota bacterium]
MRCHACHTINAYRASACTACRSPLEAACPSCGEGVLGTYRFCPACGQRLGQSASGERRQVTVLFADLTGYTALSSKLDPEETHALLNRYFDVVDAAVRRYGGRIDKHIGDAVMAVFGAPVAHANDPERAVRAALDIHRGVSQLDPPLKTHAGIASGTVVASETGSHHHREYTVIGDAVNLAARLMDKAAPGETVVADNVKLSVGARIAFGDRGEVPVKGLARPVRIWAPTHVVEDLGVDLGPLVGRESERARLEQVISDVKQGHGVTVVLTGEAGIGKTRVLEELVAMATDERVVSCRAWVLDFGMASGQDATRALVRALHARAGESPEGAPQEGHRRHLAALLDLPLSEQDRMLLSAMEPAARQRGEREALVALAEQACRAGPVVITVEDVHGADAPLLECLTALAALTMRAPLVVAVTARAEASRLVDAAWLARAECRVVGVPLGPLDRDAARAMAAAHAVPDDVVELCVERAGGNPFFLEQLLRSGVDGGATELPGSVRSVVQARMDRLSPVDRTALQAAATLGTRFPLRALRAVLNNDAYHCQELEAHHLVRCVEEQVGFTQALVQETVYATLVRATRSQFHQRAAEHHAHDAPLRAEHLIRAESPTAAEACVTAVQELLGHHEHHRALRLLDLAAREKAAGSPSARFQLRALRGEVLRVLGRVPEAMEEVRHALEQATHDEERVRAWIGMAECYRAIHRAEDVLPVLDHAEPLARQHGMLRALADIHHLRANAAFTLRRYEECVRGHEQARVFSTEARWVEGQVRALGGMGDAAHLSGHAALSCLRFRECVALARARNLVRVEVANAPMVGWAGFFDLQTLGMIDEMEQAARRAGHVGNLRAQVLAQLLQGLLLLEQHDLEKAVPLLEVALQTSSRAGTPLFAVEGLVFLCRAAMLQGDVARARARLAEAAKVCEQPSVRAFSGPWLVSEELRYCEDAAERARLRREAEALEPGAPAFMNLMFREASIRRAAQDGEVDLLERDAEAVAAQHGPEMSRYARMLWVWARGAASALRGERNAELMHAVQTVAELAERAGLRVTAGAIRRTTALRA